MREFDFTRAGGLSDAAEALGPEASVIAGGTNLLDLMKIEVMTPRALVDITHIEGLSEITAEGEGLRIGALVTNSAKYAHYAPALAKKRVRFASLERCVAAARTGLVPREAPRWLAS